MIEIKGKKMTYGINFPTSIEEITPEVLNEITKGVKLPKHYCIIALAFTTKVFDFCTAINSNRDTNVSVTSILAKIHDEDVESVNANVGDKIIIDRSSLERGSHLYLKYSISYNFAKKYFNMNPELTKDIITKSKEIVGHDHFRNKPITSAELPNIIILEFKICPVTDIAASIPMNFNASDPFIVYEKDAN